MITCVEPARLYFQVNTHVPDLFDAAFTDVPDFAHSPVDDAFVTLKSVNVAPRGNVIKVVRAADFPAFKVFKVLNLIFGLGFE